MFGKMIAAGIPDCWSAAFRTACIGFGWKSLHCHFRELIPASGLRCRESCARI